MTSTNFDRTIYQAFILDEEKVKSLSKILHNRVGEASISTICADDATRRFESVDKFLEYENARDRRIISLSLHSYSKDRASEENGKIGITYSTKYKYMPISISVEGPEEWASITMRQLVEVVEGSRPWYSRISKVDEFILMGLFAAILCFLLIRAEAISSPPGFIEIFSLLGLGFVPAWGMKYVIRYLFPSGVYLIGQEKARNETRRTMRWTVIALIFGGVFTTLLGFLG